MYAKQCSVRGLNVTVHDPVKIDGISSDVYDLETLWRSFAGRELYSRHGRVGVSVGHNVAEELFLFTTGVYVSVLIKVFYDIVEEDLLAII